MPGRATIIGEHTDYNEGLSLAVALPNSVSVSTSPSHDGFSHLEADGFDPWSDDQPATTSHARLAAAVLAELGAGPVRLTVDSSLPSGVGLSSSAAYVGALALALGATGSLLDLARLLQRCEARAGSDVGLLDQLTCLGARSGRALLIDFSGPTTSDVVLSEAVEYLAVYCGVSRSLGATPYRERRAECARVAELLGPWKTLSEADLGRLGDPALVRRARHVLTENERVREFLRVNAADDAAGIGRVLTAGQDSLREDFEVSCPEVDRLVAQAAREPGVLGARMIGGGFGGCVLVAHEPGKVPDLDGRPRWPVVPSAGALERLGR